MDGKLVEESVRSQGLARVDCFRLKRRKVVVMTAGLAFARVHSTGVELNECRASAAAKKYLQKGGIPAVTAYKICDLAGRC